MSGILDFVPYLAVTEHVNSLELVHCMAHQGDDRRVSQAFTSDGKPADY